MDYANKNGIEFLDNCVFFCRSAIIGFIKISHGYPVDSEYLQRVQCVHVAFTSTHFDSLKFTENWTYLT